MMPKMFPKGSTTEAVVNPSPRTVSASCSFAPMDSNRSRVAGRSSTCQYMTAPAGPFAELWGASAAGEPVQDKRFLLRRGRQLPRQRGPLPGRRDDRCGGDRVLYARGLRSRANAGRLTL